MRRRLFTWPRLIVSAALAVLVGLGGWLAAGSTGANGSPPVAATPGPPAASAGATPKLDLQALPATAPAPRPANCGRPSLAGASGTWLPGWLDDPGRPSLIAEQASRLRLLDFFWLSLGATPESIVGQPGNPGGSSLATVLGTAAAANPCGWRFITISDEQTPKQVMAQILLDPAARWRNVAALATVMAGYPQANGLTLDYEYALPGSQSELDLYASVAHWHGLTARQEIGRITAGYTEFVRELALAMHRQHRALRVAVRVRTSDEIDYTDLSDLTPFLYDYGELAKYADQIVLMAIDFHWATGDPGPIVTLSDLRNVLSDVRAYHIPSARLAVESAMYGYDWTLNRAGHRQAGTQAATVTATDLADLADRGWVEAGSKDGETYYEYTAGGQRHAVWFAGTGLKYQAAQLRRLCPGCAVMAWATGNTDPAGSALIMQALGG
ncbi:MAG TPA: glycosyl hydrolase family 18 protein [Streptosporangiaceae bacterium]|nr:glycosyl hydrolase family 18 protein [Streptosporangiaceae bacterium]